eukprot:403370180
MDLMRRMSIMHTIETTFEQFLEQKKDNQTLLEDPSLHNNTVDGNYVKNIQNNSDTINSLKLEEQNNSAIYHQQQNVIQNKRSSITSLFYEVNKEERRASTITPMSNSKKKSGYLQKRDDLKYKTLAKYKAVCNGDILSYDLIDQGLMRRPSIRALALENTSIEEFERELQQNASEYEDPNKPSGRHSSIDNFDERQSNVRSSREYWQEINTQDSKYKNAVIIKDYRSEALDNIKLGNRNKNTRQYQQNQANTTNRLLKHQSKNERNFELEERRKRSTIQSNQNKEEFNQKIEKIQRAHEIEMKNTKTLAKNYAIEYFKTKALELTQIFTNESYHVIEKYEELKEKLQQKEIKIYSMNQNIKRQEQIISELRNYIKQNIDRFTKKVTENKVEIKKEMIKKISQLQLVKDEEGRDQYINNQSLFDLYGSYVDLVKPQKKNNQKQILQRENAKLWERINSMTTEMEAIQNICQQYFQEEQSFKQTIEKLELDKEQLIQEITNLKQDMASKSLQYQDKYSRDIEYFKCRYQQIKDFVSIEVQVNEAIAQLSNQHLVNVESKLKETKHVLRTPRLYGIYQDKMREYMLPRSQGQIRGLLGLGRKVMVGQFEQTILRELANEDMQNQSQILNEKEDKIVEHKRSQSTGRDERISKMFKVRNMTIDTLRSKSRGEEKLSFASTGPTSRMNQQQSRNGTTSNALAIDLFSNNNLQYQRNLSTNQHNLLSFQQTSLIRPQTSQSQSRRRNHNKFTILTNNINDQSLQTQHLAQNFFSTSYNNRPTTQTNRQLLLQDNSNIECTQQYKMKQNISNYDRIKKQNYRELNQVLRDCFLDGLK